MTSLLLGAMTQLRVVHALALRETRTRFGAHRLGYLWALLEPLLWIGTFWGFFAIAHRQAPDGMDVVPFMATGIIPYNMAIQTAEKGSQAINGNKALLFYPHVHTLDLILARGALEVATLTVVLLVITGGWALFTEGFVLDDALRVATGLGLAGLFGMALGLVLCSAGVMSNSVDRIRGPLFRPLFWISGLFFTANGVPTRVRELMLYNPILHCVELVRDGWFPTYHARYADAGYVLLWIVGLAFVGLTLERKVRSKVQLT